VLGASHKAAPWESLRASLGVPAEACAHVGDDLPDVPLLAACGLAVTVPHAPESVRRHAHYVTRREGGAGAVREVAELILAAQDRLAAAEAPHTAPPGGP
jgi:3-deoxy-D-manno-octulosonate 8-phosphate phosphatase (KDO 8-P phosphatase)